MSDVAASAHWHLIRRLTRGLVSRCAKQALRNRELIQADGEAVRWLPRDASASLKTLEAEAAQIRPTAKLSELPSFGNRLMVELAVYTIALDRALKRAGLEPRSARDIVADTLWRLYRQMLVLTSLPVRVLTRDPGRRLRWTIRMLLRFPFNAPGAPGYQVDTWVDGEDIMTHFTHCPPQSFVRSLSEETGDIDALETFRSTWCLYDWPGADIIAGDNKRGHYHRHQTLSSGDPVCDMCWMARGSGQAAHGTEFQARTTRLKPNK